MWLGLGVGVPTRAADDLSQIASLNLGSPIAVDVSSGIGVNGRIGGGGRVLVSELQVEYLPGFEASASGLTPFEWSLLTTT